MPLGCYQPILVSFAKLTREVVTSELEWRSEKGHEMDRKLVGRLRMNSRLSSEAKSSAEKACSAARVATRCLFLAADSFCAQTEWLLPLDGAGSLEAEGMERTYRFSQAALAGAADAVFSRKAFDLELPQLGPYSCAYSPNGRHLLLAGRRGHVALVEWGAGRVVAELQTREVTRAAAFLHNTSFFAAAQEKYVYVYDKRGQEVHCLREHERPLALAFLPRFFLLASVGDGGVLRWTDTSTGALVASHASRLGRCGVLAHNPASGVLAAGHANGTLTLWSPSSGTPLARLLAHRGGVTAAAVDAGGRALVTAGADAQLKVWDLRTFGLLHAYFTPTPASCVAVSQRGCVAVGCGSHVQVWPHTCLAAKAASPLLTHLAGGGGAPVCGLAFAPYEDVLGCGHARGFASLLVRPAGGRAGNRRRAVARAPATPPGGCPPPVGQDTPREMVSGLGRNSGRARRGPARGRCLPPGKLWRQHSRSAHPSRPSPLRRQVPCAGEPNFDSFVANPFESKRQRQEGEVRALLDKLPPAMIVLDPDALAGVAREPKDVAAERRATAAAASAAARRDASAATEARAKGKGRRKASRTHRRKQLNVVEETRKAVLDTRVAAKQAAAPPTTERAVLDGGGLPLALRRFVKKR